MLSNQLTTEGYVNNEKQIITSADEDSRDTWQTATGSTHAPFAIVLGTLTQRRNGVWPSIVFPQDTAVMILDGNTEGRLHCAGYAFVTNALTLDWTFRDVTVGGPTCDEHGIPPPTKPS